MMLRVATPTGASPKIPVLITGGIHAREWAPPDTLLEFADRLAYGRLLRTSGVLSRAAVLGAALAMLLFSSVATATAPSGGNDAARWLLGTWKAPGSYGLGPLTLRWTEAPRGFHGVLSQLDASARPKVVATYEILTTPANWTLRLQEGGRGYTFQYAVSNTDALHFTRRTPKSGPTAVVLRLLDNKLFLGQKLGPQHGAALERTFTFDRAGE